MLKRGFAIKSDIGRSSSHKRRPDHKTSAIVEVKRRMR
jgi:hypothetical protein